MSNHCSDFCCLFCNLELKNIFIKCIECVSEASSICLDCFSCGNENQAHKNTHSYRVVNLNDIKTFENWSVNDELEMLRSIKSSNLIKMSENQNSIKHLEKWFDYITHRDKKHVLVDPFRLNRNRVKSTMMLTKDENFSELAPVSVTGGVNGTKFSFNLPPTRPIINSKQYRLMSGYRYARGDFETEHNDKFEIKLIADIDYTALPTQILNKEDADEQENETDELLDSTETNDVELNLKISLLHSYNDLIKERYERKRFIKEFGLLNELALNDQYNALINSNNKNSLPLQHQLPLKFQRLFRKYEEYAKFYELMHYRYNLKKRIDELKEYRANGIRSLKFINIYKNQKLKRLNRTHTMHLASLVTSISQYNYSNAPFGKINNVNKIQQNKQQCQEWFKQFVMVEKSSLKTDENNNKIILNNQPGDVKSTDVKVEAPNASPATAAPLPNHLKYKNNPLKIENYPDCDKLDEGEKEFCRVARVQPTVYLRVKAILLLENSKAGFCTYSRARKIAGIDVNKTRLIHNLMIKNGLLNISPPT